MRNDTPLFRSDLLSIDEHDCDAPRHGWSAEQGGEPPHIVLVRRGSFGVRGRIEAVADPYSVLVYDGLHSYRFHRPADGGDATTRITPNPALMEEALGRSAIHVRVTPKIYLRHLRLYSLAKGSGLPAAEIEEAAIELLHAISAQSGTFDDLTTHTRARRRVADARAYVASIPEANHRLGEVAAIAGCSPFHFARLFRQETGSSLRAYRLRLRLAMAIERLAEGADDLTMLALDTGFSHHSHMTAAFKKVLGKSPSAIRGGLNKSRTFLKASLDAAA